MRIAGIIAEYNPFHAGHAWQIAALRRQGFDAVVCVCSPSVVQRGTPALFPAGVRCAAALAGGADMVITLPAPYAVCSAEGFAFAAVQLLAALGVCEVIAFGSECGDTKQLEKTAALLRTDAFSEALRAALARGVSFAAARTAAAEQLLPGSAAVLTEPNNNLAVEYCKALLQLCAEHPAQKLPAPLALPRKGAAHDAPLDVSHGGFASATALRELSLRQGAAALAPYVPPACLPIYLEAEKNGLIFAPHTFEIATLSRLRALSGADFARVRGASEGLDNRLAAAVRSAATLEELYTAVKSKRYAHARVRRFVLDAALGFTNALPARVPFLHIPGTTPAGAAVLRRAKECALLPIGHSLRALERHSPQAAAVASAHAAAEDFAALCLRSPQPCGSAYTAKHLFTAKKEGGI